MHRCPRSRRGPFPPPTASSNSSNEHAVLSRIAESLSWIGRYTERAEDTARLLDVHYHHLLEDRWADEAVACTGLLRAMGDEPDDLGPAIDADTVTDYLAFDRKNPTSITASLTAAWENARGAR